MQPKFKIIMANEDQSVKILWKEKPVNMEEYIEVFKSLLCSFGFSEETVRRYFEFEDIIQEYEETIQEMQKEIDTLKGRTFQLHEGGCK